MKGSPEELRIWQPSSREWYFLGHFHGRATAPPQDFPLGTSPRSPASRSRTSRELYFLGYFHGRATAPPKDFSLETIPRSPASRSRTKLVVKVGEYFCLIVALVCLGRVVLFYGGARIFQFYQSARFDGILSHNESPHASKLAQWIGHTIAAFRNEPAAPQVNHEVR